MNKIKIDDDGVKYYTTDGTHYFSPANERIKTLAKMYQDQYSIETVFEKHEDFIVAKTSIRFAFRTDFGERVFTGYGSQSLSDPTWGGANAIMVAETKSVSRAIAKLGIGIEFSNASLEEISPSNEFVFDMEPDAEEKSKRVTEHFLNSINKSNEQK